MARIDRWLEVFQCYQRASSFFVDANYLGGFISLDFRGISL
jgi:hypothetical protein